MVDMSDYAEISYFIHTDEKTWEGRGFTEAKLYINSIDSLKKKLFNLYL